MEDQIKQRVPLVIINEGKEQIEQDNREKISRLKTNNPDSIILFFDIEAQKELFNNVLSKRFSREVINLLDFEGFSYGRIMNKQFLIAAALGADYVHRRDSDVKINLDFGFPSEFELMFLGKKVYEANQIMQEENVPFDKNKEIYLVGSGYSGGSDWKVDYSPFLPEDAGLILEINKLAGYTENLSKEYYNEIITGNISVDKKVKYLPQDDHPNPLCGNLSFYKIFKFIPCSPLFSTIGSDNFIRDMLKSINFPIIYHTNFVYHTFTSDRSKDDFDYLGRYWPRVVNKLDYYATIRRYIFSILKNDMDKFITIQDLNIKDVINGFKQEDTFNNQKRAFISEFAGILQKAKNNKIVALGERFNTQEFQDYIINNTTHGMNNHKILLNQWPDIIEYLNGIDSRSLCNKASAFNVLPL